MNKRSIYILSIGTLLLLSACESKERKGASAMLDTASQYYQQEAYEEALQLLDSLNKVYPKEVEAREQALALSREVRLARSRRDSLAIIPRMQALIQYTDSLYREFSLVEAPGMPDENIIRYKGYDPSSANPQDSFLDCYIASDGTLELIAATSGADTQGVTHIQVSESVGNTFVSSDTLAYDGGLNYRFQDLGRHYERLTFTGEKAIKVASFITNAPERATIKITFGRENGKKGRVFNLDKRAKEAITKSYLYAQGLLDIAELQRGIDTHSRRLLLETERQTKEAISKK